MGRYCSWRNKKHIPYKILVSKPLDKRKMKWKGDIKIDLGRAIAQAVSRRLPTAAAPVQTRV
jgi:hypothetical protein